MIHSGEVVEAGELRKELGDFLGSSTHGGNANFIAGHIKTPTKGGALIVPLEVGELLMNIFKDAPSIEGISQKLRELGMEEEVIAGMIKKLLKTITDLQKIFSQIK